MTSRHTPGPWVAYELAPEDPSWGACEIWPDENDRDDEEGTVKPVATMVMGVENARLIAAAPELLAALDEITNYQGGADSALDDEYVMERVTAAIAKATGEDACAT